jgi:hypothetical protein
VTGIGGGTGSAIGGFGATTGVAWLRIFLARPRPLLPSVHPAGERERLDLDHFLLRRRRLRHIEDLDHFLRQFIPDRGDRLINAMTSATCSKATKVSVAARSRRLRFDSYMLVNVIAALLVSLRSRIRRY